MESHCDRAHDNPPVLTWLQSNFESVMRTLHIKFSDADYERLKAGKGDRTWSEALLEELAEDPDDE